MEKIRVGELIVECEKINEGYSCRIFPILQCYKNEQLIYLYPSLYPFKRIITDDLEHLKKVLFVERDYDRKHENCIYNVYYKNDIIGYIEEGTDGWKVMRDDNNYIIINKTFKDGLINMTESNNYKPSFRIHSQLDGKLIVL